MRYVLYRLMRMVLCITLVVGVSAASHAAGYSLNPELTLSSLPDAPEAQASSTQTNTPPQSAGQQQPLTDEQKKKQLHDEAEHELHEEEQQHVFGVVPYFNTVNRPVAAPLSPGQKFELAFKSSTNPFVFLTTGLLAAYGQIINNFPAYGQGAAGYGKRYGAQFADTFDGNMLGNAVFPILFHQDPRYYRMGTGSFRKRFLYSISTSFRTKGDNGQWQPAYSNILGNYAAGGISNLYYPAADRGFGLTIQRGTVVTAEQAVGALVTEFIPDIEHYVLHRKNPPSDKP